MKQIKGKTRNPAFHVVKIIVGIIGGFVIGAVGQGITSSMVVVFGFLLTTILFLIIFKPRLRPKLMIPLLAASFATLAAGIILYLDSAFQHEQVADQS